MAWTPSDIQQALAFNHIDVPAAQRRMAPSPRPEVRPSDQPGQMRVGAVMLLLYPHEDELNLVFLQRPLSLKHHPGQIAFPGGRQEPNETLQTTALRETYEEIGVAPEAINVLGRLAHIYIPPSDFEVHPFVGWHAGRPQFSPSQDEVERLLEVPVTHFLDDQHRDMETRHFGQISLSIPFFQVGEDKIWGGTAAMLNEFVARLAALSAAEASES